jgi:beta-N-acetylhexosaminidase
MALGAAHSVELARRAGEVLGREMAAVGVNVNYAPCVDVNLNPANPVVGVRSFGENPESVARLGAALVEGIQSQGVAATAKHFPGHGDTASDSHHGLANAPHSLERLRDVEFPPFISSIEAGVKMIMSAHLALPAVEGPDAPPATLSERVLKGLLRGELGYEGVIITDALDMRAIRQGEALGEEALRAVKAGADLLLVTSNPEDQARVYHAVMRAVRAGRLDAEELEQSARRVFELKSWLRDSPPKPDLSAIRSADHLRVADEIAEKSITLVRDEKSLLPIRLETGQRIAAIIPRPLDLTPADTSSYLTPFRIMI